MRISDIRGEAVIDVIADIIEPVANIAQDEEMAALFKREVVDEDADRRALAVARLKKHAPRLIKNHKHDVITILAAINGVDRDEYEAQLNIAKLFKDVADVFSDSELVGFFTSQVTSDGSEDTASDSISTITEQPLALA